MRSSFVYILASARNGTLYTGVTSDILGRVHQHKAELTEGFSKRYGVKILVWFEPHTDIRNAIQREKNIKHWPRAWKLALIENANPTWRDLYADLTG
jgi:putative endonuclease